jgi:hypothetical protein
MALLRYGAYSPIDTGTDAMSYQISERSKWL